MSGRVLIIAALMSLVCACTRPPGKSSNSANGDPSNASNVSTNNGTNNVTPTNGLTNVGNTNDGTNGVVGTNNNTNVSTNNSTNAVTNNDTSGTNNGTECGPNRQCSEGVCLQGRCVECQSYQDCPSCMYECIPDTGECVPREILQTTVSNPDTDVHIELRWFAFSDQDPADDAGPDMDLHYRRGDADWDAEPNDTFWNNRDPDWGVTGDESDDPALVQDSTTGPGPETVQHSGLEPDVTYSTGAYYYAENGFGPSCVAARIWVDGSLVTEDARLLQSTFEFWYVADIDGATRMVSEVDSVTEDFPSP